MGLHSLRGLIISKGILAHLGRQTLRAFLWHVCVLIFLLQAASAGFTPTFQATIPDVLPAEAEYTRALSLSRLAYDLETLLADARGRPAHCRELPRPLRGTVIRFLASAALVLTVALPSPRPAQPRGVWDRSTRGIRM